MTAPGWRLAWITGTRLSPDRLMRPRSDCSTRRWAQSLELVDREDAETAPDTSPPRRPWGRSQPTEVPTHDDPGGRCRCHGWLLRHPPRAGRTGGDLPRAISTSRDTPPPGPSPDRPRA